MLRGRGMYRGRGKKLMMTLTAGRKYIGAKIRGLIMAEPETGAVPNTPADAAVQIAVVVQSAVVNHKGFVRDNNEDNFYLDGIYMQRDRMDEGAFMAETCANEYQLYAVCDGMGGTESGEDAAFCAVSALAEKKKDYKQLTDEKYLTEMLRGISEKVCSEALARDQKSGTTIAMVLVDKDRVHVSNVGDSRIYRFRRGILSQVSTDHSKVQRMVAMGLMSEEQARMDPSRHIISQYLGMPEEVRISPFVDSLGRLQKDDVFLLCSDGLSDMVKDRQIEEILQRGQDPGDTARMLMEAALANGGRDNTTVMVLKVIQSSTQDSRDVSL